MLQYLSNKKVYISVERLDPRQKPVKLRNYDVFIEQVISYPHAKQQLNLNELSNHFAKTKTMQSQTDDLNAGRRRLFSFCFYINIQSLKLMSFPKTDVYKLYPSAWFYKNVQIPILQCENSKI